MTIGHRHRRGFGLVHWFWRSSQPLPPGIIQYGVRKFVFGKFSRYCTLERRLGRTSPQGSLTGSANGEGIFYILVGIVYSKSRNEKGLAFQRIVIGRYAQAQTYVQILIEKG